MSDIRCKPASRQERRIVFAAFGLLVSLLLFPFLAFAAPPANFDRAKVLLRQQVYHDQNVNGALGEFYCGCNWDWVGSSGGRIDFESCGYEVRAQPTRASRIEWEHIVPAYWLGNQRQCWQEGGRQNCVSTDPAFRAMEADMHNLSPSVGEVNADRSNYRFGMLPGEDYRHGACEFKVNFSERTAEPRNEIKGQVARVYFYMYDRYDLRMSDQQERLLMAWDRSYPVSQWELERDRRIASIMGHSNPFVTGERQWTRGHRNSGDGVRPADSPQTQTVAMAQALPVIGNRNSSIYHLPAGCAGYNQVSEGNRVYFDTEAEALAAGFRRAGNCRNEPAPRQDVSFNLPDFAPAERLLSFVEARSQLRIGMAVPVLLKLTGFGFWDGVMAFEQMASLPAPGAAQATDT